jgi:hypothetical protein
MARQLHSPLDVCCHTCHRHPGESCQWDREGEFHRTRERHFEAQKKRATCPVCMEDEKGAQS